MTITVNRAALKLFLDLWKKEMFTNFDKAERIAGLKTAIDNVPLPVLRQAADNMDDELVTFEFDPETKQWQTSPALSTP